MCVPKGCETVVELTACSSYFSEISFGRFRSRDMENQAREVGDAPYFFGVVGNWVEGWLGAIRVGFGSVWWFY